MHMLRANVVGVCLCSARSWPASCYSGNFAAT
jgi:hypothetical protein